MNLSGTAVLLSTVSGYFAEADNKRMQNVCGESAKEQARFVSMGQPFLAPY